MKYIVPALFVFSIVYFVIPVLKSLAVLTDFQDKPTKRKKHSHSVPLLGGVGIFIGFTAGFLFFFRPYNENGKYLLVLFASTLVFGIGVVDDWYKTRQKEFAVLPRIIVQILAAMIVYKAGIVFSGFTNPISHNYIVLPSFIQFLCTIVWILGVTTVINWSDGIDGLAGSLSGISGATLFIVAVAKKQPNSATLSILVVASALGFLRYNKHPAQIFMGDSGANFLGFILGIIALDGAFKQATVVSIFIPIFALGVPIVDNLLVVLRRLKRGKPVYQADSSQMHHRLLSSGLNQKQAWLFISLLSVCSSLISIIILLLKI
jgi:UDP-GlcNAc:undecaprenyl-phosphate/decaprenyl-phosphate GlcNAc-1-phosphate transferase